MNRKLISWMGQHGDGELRQYCDDTLARLNPPEEAPHG
jgi:hypothetical protein